MTNILKFVQVFALGTWVGSIFYFSAAVAPGAFRVLPSQDLAGVLVEFTLRRLHTLGVVAGIVFLLAAALAMSASGFRRSVLLPSIGVAIIATALLRDLPSKILAPIALAILALHPLLDVSWLPLPLLSSSTLNPLSKNPSNIRCSASPRNAAAKFSNSARIWESVSTFARVSGSRAFAR